MASRSLFDAQQKGVTVNASVMQRAENYALNSTPVDAAISVGAAREVSASSAGVPLYQSAQALEQLSRTEKDRKKNEKQIAKLNAQLSDAAFVNGFGSIGGEEFFSYLNIGDSLKRTGGDEWKKWNSNITQKILNLQNGDGTWAGHHCITGRVAVTSAAILNLSAGRAN